MGNFNIGDVVRLKSGGPRMTVSSVDPDMGVYCRWFEGSKSFQEAFEPETLEKAERAVGAVASRPG